MTQLRGAALAAIAVLVAAASLVSFAESYRALYLWAAHHGLHGAWAYLWPLQIDTFVAVGELALLVALADSWPARSRVAAWCVTGLGLAVSVLGNIGHVTGHDPAARATAAVPPLAAAAALAVGLGVLKRVMAGKSAAQLPVPEPESATEKRDFLSPGGAVPAGPGPVPAALNGAASAARELFAAELDAGRVPGIRAIKAGLSVGQDKAVEVRDYLRALTAESGTSPRPVGTARTD